MNESELGAAPAGVWTMERLRGMTRAQFNEAVKRDGPPPVELGLQLITERIGWSFVRP